MLNVKFRVLPLKAKSCEVMNYSSLETDFYMRVYTEVLREKSLQILLGPRFLISEEQKRGNYSLLGNANKTKIIPSRGVLYL